MGEDSRSGLSKPTLLFAVLVISFIQWGSGADSSNELLCSMDLSSFLPLPYGSLPNMVCKPLWNSFLLRYSQTKDHEITIVLSTMYTSGWVGMGFSRDGMMLNSSSMVGWVTAEGRARIRQYHLQGFTPSEIKPDQGELPLTSVPPYVALNSATIYLAFQLKYNSTLKNQPVLLAFGTKPPHHLRLTHHDDKTSLLLDFSSGKADATADSTTTFTTSIFKDRRTHGTLALLAWGLFLPMGAIFARYLRHKDKLWYYLHVVIQFIGFILGVAAVVVGLSLNSELHASIPAHKGMGIFILTITILQVLAFFLRPSKDSKLRKYWNWYHNWLGRLCLLFAAVNIVLGIHIAGSEQAWKIGYGFLVGSVLVTSIVLETLLRLKMSRDKDRPPAFTMSSLKHDQVTQL